MNPIERTALSYAAAWVLAFVLLITAVSVPACRASKPAEPEHAGPKKDTSSLKKDTGSNPDSSQNATFSLQKDTSLPEKGTSSKPSGILGFFGKVLGTTGRPNFKKATINTYYGPATVTTNTVGKKATAATAEGATAATSGKKAGPSIVASDSASQNTAGGQLQAVNGDGNTLKQEATTEEAAGFGGAIGKWAGIGLAVLLIGGACYFLIPLFKRRKANEQA